MVSPTKPSPINASAGSYSAVPNATSTSPRLNPPSPSLSETAGGEGYSGLSGRNLPSSSYLSPEQTETSRMLSNRDSFMPAPSIISRDSTYSSLATGGNRNSWGSNAALAGAAGAAAGEAGRRPSAPRGQSNLAHSSVGWNNASDDRLSTSEEDDGQGHIAPAGALGGAAGLGAAGLSEKPAWAPSPYKKKSRTWLWVGLGVAALIVIGLGVGLGVGLTVGKDGNNSSNAGGNSGAAAGGGSSRSGSPTQSARPSATTSALPTTGTQGSLITLADGTTMTYDNPHGGKWVYDPENPFNNEAQAQSWSPALNQNWTWGVDKIYGVNLGGWLDTEPFIVPGLYETYATGANGQTAIDEYTLSQNMGDNLTAAMTEHYETFITERDFVEIVSAGLNWIRLPIGHWAVATSSEEPYLERVSWTYVLRAIGWARKYGIRINFDLHTVPGSQNGWNHSGRLGSINWMSGIMGLANAQRSLDIIRTLTQFMIQPEYAPVIPMFGFINEPNAGAIGKNEVGAFYLETYRMIREITGIGEGNGPYLSMHDGFLGIQQWQDFLPGADRLALDQHPYMAFGDQPQGTFAEISRTPCQWWAEGTNRTSNQFGVNSAGEWSAASNDCGQWVNRVGAGSRYDGTFDGYTGPRGALTCAFWNDWTQWDQATKDNLRHFVMAEMDALQNFFFWTWRIGNSTGSIPEPNPFWHYRLGLREGWIPNDPRMAIGTCAEDGVVGPNFDGTYSAPYMTGGPGAGTIAPAETAAYTWPPASFTNVPAGQMTNLPQYTQTGSPVTMPAPTFTKANGDSIDAGDGWQNPADNRQAYAPIAGCSYPPEYSAADLPVPASACGAGLDRPTRRSEPAAKRTPAPVVRR